MNISVLTLARIGAFLTLRFIVSLIPENARAEDELLPEALEKVRASCNVSALAAATMAEGKIAESAATGFRKFGAPERVTLDDRWHIGSCTKSMTATLAAMLVETASCAGKLRWAKYSLAFVRR